MIGHASGAQDRNVPISQMLQPTVETQSESVGENGRAQEREWPESERFVFNLEQTRTPQGLIEEGGMMVDHLWQVLRKPYLHAHQFQQAFHTVS
jgi:hypothetical protein